jgi:hypothetical protein
MPPAYQRGGEAPTWLPCRGSALRPSLAGLVAKDTIEEKVMALKDKKAELGQALTTAASQRRRREAVG